jgi:hypothetical protein
VALQHTTFVEQFKPTAIHFYFDRMRVWLQQPISTVHVRRLRKECGRGGLHDVSEPAWFDRRYRQKLELHQPSTLALQSLSRLGDGVLLNYVEIACDLIFSDRDSVERCLELFMGSFVQPWHRNTMQVRAYPEGYTTRAPPQPGERRVGHWSQYYVDKTSRLTGAPHCFHFEGKHEGVQFVRRSGSVIHGISSLSVGLTATPRTAVGP